MDLRKLENLRFLGFGLAVSKRNSTIPAVELLFAARRLELLIINIHC